MVDCFKKAAGIISLSASHILQCDSMIPPIGKWRLFPHPLDLGWTCDSIWLQECWRHSLCQFWVWRKGPYMLHLSSWKLLCCVNQSGLAWWMKREMWPSHSVTPAHSQLICLTCSWTWMPSEPRWGQKSFSPNGWPAESWAAQKVAVLSHWLWGWLIIQQKPADTGISMVTEGEERLGATTSKGNLAKVSNSEQVRTFPVLMR